jgi:hypothetical protein
LNATASVPAKCPQMCPGVLSASFRGEMLVPDVAQLIPSPCPLSATTPLPAPLQSPSSSNRVRFSLPLPPAEAPRQPFSSATKRASLRHDILTRTAAPWKSSGSYWAAVWSSLATWRSSKTNSADAKFASRYFDPWITPGSKTYRITAIRVLCLLCNEASSSTTHSVRRATTAIAHVPDDIAATRLSYRPLEDAAKCARGPGPVAMRVVTARRWVRSCPA